MKKRALKARKILVEALRSLPDEGLPEGFTPVPGDGNFRWQYQTSFVHHECGSAGCAMGLAKALGLIPYPELAYAAEALDLPYERARAIFYDPGTYGFPRPAAWEREAERKSWGSVTPHMVADELERTYQ